MTSKLSLFLIPLAGVFLLPGCERAPDLPPGYGDWPHHQGDLAASKYVPLDQITPQNFEQLEVAWRWESADRRLGDVYDTGTYVATPLKVGDRLYTATSHGQVVALDPGTGEQLWLHDPRSWAEEMPTQLPRHTRGVEYWTDGEVERIFIATLGKQLVSIDAATGIPDPAFGDNGVVDLKNDLGGDGDWVTAHIAHRAPPIVVRDTVVVGSGVHDYVSELRNPPGHVRAYDARTGAFKWRFEVIPRKGEPFSETWPEETIDKQGNTNVWTYLSADEELGYVYLPTSTPTNDYYGGERHGDNLFAESLVAVDVETGERVWHFQTVHHGIWDYDIASAANLIDVEIDGQPRKVVAQLSKTAFAYVLDRVTGEPIWPIEERPVEQSTVPGEQTAPTQPFPTKPAPFDRQGISEDDLIDFTPELRAEALEIAAQFRLGPIFTPPIVEGDDGKLATFVVPGAGGGASYPRRLLGSGDGVALRGVEDAAHHDGARQAGDRRIDHLRSARVRAIRFRLRDQVPHDRRAAGTAAPEAALSPADGDRHADRRARVPGSAGPRARPTIRRSRVWTSDPSVPSIGEFPRAASSSPGRCSWGSWPRTGRTGPTASRRARICARRTRRRARSSPGSRWIAASRALP